MRLHPVPADERSNNPPSPPPPAQIAFPPILFSPLLFQSNSPLASPHTPPSIIRQNPFDLLPSSLPNLQSSSTHPVHDTSPFHDDPKDNPPPPTSHNSLNNTRNICLESSKNDPHPDMANRPHLIPSSSNNPTSSPPALDPYVNTSFPSSPPPTVAEGPALDICFEDDALSPLERIYLLSRSTAVYHRYAWLYCPIPFPVF